MSPQSFKDTVSDMMREEDKLAGMQSPVGGKGRTAEEIARSIISHYKPPKRKTFKDLSFNQLREKFADGFNALISKKHILEDLPDRERRAKRDIKKIKRRMKKIEKRIIETTGDLNFIRTKKYCEGNVVDVKGNILIKNDRVREIGTNREGRVDERPYIDTTVFYFNETLRIRWNDRKRYDLAEAKDLEKIF